MKKLALLGFFLLLLLSPVNVFAVPEKASCVIPPTTKADTCDQGLICKPLAANPAAGTCEIPTINITKPTQGFASLGNAVSNILTIAFTVAILVVLVMLIWGAFEWITSGGDKDTVGKARGRIINALIGLAVLAVAYALARVAAQFLGFDIGNITVPGPNPNATGF